MIEGYFLKLARLMVLYYGKVLELFLLTLYIIKLILAQTGMDALRIRTEECMCQEDMGEVFSADKVYLKMAA
jgi:hypothetical protein